MDQTNAAITGTHKNSQFNKLHFNGKMLLLPNVWDAIGAALIQSVGYPAVATSSMAIANANGFPDGEKMPFNQVLDVLKKIVDMVNIPVTADIEAGYSADKVQLGENIERVLQTGIAGINFEDSNPAGHYINGIDEQCRRIALIKGVSASTGVPVFINARIDVLLYRDRIADEAGMQEIIVRAKAYLEAGADGIFPIFIHNEKDIRTILNNVDAPLNLIAMPNIPAMETLNQMGVSRLSLGPGLMNVAIARMKDVAEKLKNYNGLEEITQCPVSFRFLQELISKSGR